MRRITLSALVMLAMISVSGINTPAADAPALTAMARMSVREITVFKDGHAFVLQSGRMPTDKAGNVVLDYLPQPVFGAFWPYCSEKAARLTGATAAKRRVRLERTALSIRELVTANPGARVIVNDSYSSGGVYEATIIGVPVRSSEEKEDLAPPGSAEQLPERGNIVLLRTGDGVKAVPLDGIRTITFRDQCREKATEEEFRDLITLSLDWGGGKPRPEAEVGLVYLQKGLRWIPEYKVNIDGQGNARVTFQATLINELADLEDVTANLVIGVPSFLFKDTLDPMALKQAAAPLSQYFSQDSDANMLSNTMVMTQQIAAPRVARPRPVPGGGGGEADLGPDVAGMDANEDLYMFKLQHISLPKGQRMAVPVSEFTVKYRDVYALDIPFAPPLEVRRTADTSRQAELAKLLAEPRVKHRLALTNSMTFPLTTAPAVVLRDGQLLAQGMMTYTSPGAESLLDLTTAVNVRVSKTDSETKRTPNAVRWQGDDYLRVDLAGEIHLVNFSKETVEVDVNRQVLGNALTASEGGKIEMTNVVEDLAGPTAIGYPYWWYWYSWPYWWNHFNGIGQVRWTVHLEPGKEVKLSYTWNYFWR